MRLISLLAWLLCTSTSMAGWAPHQSDTGEVSMRYTIGDNGAKNIKSILEKLKKSGNLDRLETITFPSFSEGDYASRLKEAFLKVAPEEAKKIFNSNGVKSWSYYSKLEQKLGDAYATLEEFKNLRSELEQYGFRISRVRAEKFSYFDYKNEGKAVLLGIAPTARLQPIIPDANPASEHGIALSVFDREEKGDKSYLKCYCSPINDKQVKLKGKWSSSLKAYVVSNVEVYQHTGVKWELNQIVDTGVDHWLHFKKDGFTNILVPVENLNANKAVIVVKVGNMRLHSRLY